MVRLITHIKIAAVVKTNAIAVSECFVVPNAASRASDSGDGRAIRSISGPLLHPVVVRIEHIDRRARDDEVHWLIEIIRGGP